MSKENPNAGCFSFTEREKLYDRISHQRLMALISQAEVDIHEVSLSTNSFGEYLFVTVSCRTEQPRRLLTFWGLGFHEQRERWIAETWQWYESQRALGALPILPKDETSARIQEREAFVLTQTNPTKPSRRAAMYELLADLTDEDGALTELEDLGWAFFAEDDEDRNGE